MKCSDTKKADHSGLFPFQIPFHIPKNGDDPDDDNDHQQDCHKVRLIRSRKVIDVSDAAQCQGKDPGSDEVPDGIQARIVLHAVEAADIGGLQNRIDGIERTEKEGARNQ